MSHHDRVRLALVGLHPDRAARLAVRCGGAGGALAAIRRGRVEVPENGSAWARATPEEVGDHLRSRRVTPVFRGGPGYPDHLAWLSDAPDVLFSRGTIPATAGVAVVGTRRATGYGRSLAGAFGRALAAAGWPVVSGLARGIDGAAHAGTVDAGGVGVAVLGSGPDVWYPREHRGLGEGLLAGEGAVVSEFPPGTPPAPWRFPVRNRIIAGLAGVVVVVEAGIKGGALITARLALEQGRTVFTVPGDVDRESSAGCNLLIRDGAHPVLGPQDLVEAVALELGPPPNRVAATAVTDDPVLAVLGAVGAGVDDLARATGLRVVDLLARLTRLEAAGIARQMEGRWTREM